MCKIITFYIKILCACGLILFNKCLSISVTVSCFCIVTISRDLQ